MQLINNSQEIIDIVKRVGKSFAGEFRQSIIPSSKAEFDKALQNIEDRCFSALKDPIFHLYPEIPWAEDDELSSIAQRTPFNDEAYWLCDTMDGAIQYLQHIAGWTINLALIQNGEPVFSIIYDPTSDELFHAEKNKGVKLNGKGLTPNVKKSADIMIAVNEYGHQLKNDHLWKEKASSSYIDLLEKFGVIRNYGPHGLQLAYVAAGRIDLFVQTDLDTNNWLAGILILKEAGYSVLSMEGKTWIWGTEGLIAGSEQALELYFKN
ncbi:myo-inositol-1-monophosphatase [Chryseobacterium lactis]|uniref:Inositol monophosphatase family protein n=1 Tax=Chryseobacterium lactis TaxID=1241981 RepID=A0A3G6RDB6_CHRLC|nr:inositol monophosphatase family protein [Chryseobacterium lactis]AZA82393.1 inositol monophosphatase family protein [Chryseobacterium lactis]AZB02775.1 inositol monophosphatase family protein [Chryseobacterium lactis]PNW13931.1 myo-inositol-1-monophosphatase [Chryseobacterium lactis]